MTKTIELSDNDLYLLLHSLEKSIERTDPHNKERIDQLGDLYARLEEIYEGR